jgi:hypothetical protein
VNSASTTQSSTSALATIRMVTDIYLLHYVSGGLWPTYD